MEVLHRYIHSGAYVSVLGVPYDPALDIWSVGCTLYELYTGKILFTGDSNNQMLRTIMEIRGRFTPKLYKRGQLASMHFDELRLKPSSLPLSKRRVHR